MSSLVKEKFDYRRFFIINRKRIWIVVLAVIIFAGLFSGTYYVKNYVLNGPDIYRSDAMYQINFDSENYDVTIAYYNDYTWNDVIDTDMIAGRAETISGIKKNEIADATSVPTMSDISLFHVYVDTDSKEKSEIIQDSIGKALAEFAADKEGFIAIKKWDQKDTFIYKDNCHIKRIALLGAITGLFIGIIIMCFISAMDDSVYVANDLLEKNINLALMTTSAMDKNKVKAILSVLTKQKGVSSVTVIYPYENYENDFDIKALLENVKVNILRKEDIKDEKKYYSEVAASEFLVLIVKSGNHDGCRICDETNLIKNMGKEVDAAIITDCSKKLIKRYYG